jgi:hypothetical protein
MGKERRDGSPGVEEEAGTTAEEAPLAGVVDMASGASVYRG